ncbi:permease for cytosine/purines, uracil, thiamine, allantoin-domain-containing protein [Amylostereum chailletii]|nr:permease for cytosine/purines, uracil, thiamine, allantoin-domain-containing protein [Amylostereum chailletii]
MATLFRRYSIPPARALLKAETWRLEPEPSTFAPSSAWSNKDMDPVPLHLRTWRTINYVAFWISDAANPAIWELASSMLAIGLSWRQVLPAIAVGNILVGIIMVLNGTIGARLRVPFPVLNRSSFGFWLSYFGVVSRVITAMFWFGIQTYTGSEAMYQMLKAVWPSFAHLPNTLPPSAHITSSGLLAYLLYWLLQFPFLMVSPQRIRWLFLAKAAVVPPAWLAMLIWALVKVPPSTGFLGQHAQVSGASFRWGWLSAVNATLSLSSTYVVNIPDFTRYAHSVRGQNIQGILIPLAFTTHLQGSGSSNARDIPRVLLST